MVAMKNKRISQKFGQTFKKLSFNLHFVDDNLCLTFAKIFWKNEVDKKFAKFCQKCLEK